MTGTHIEPPKKPVTKPETDAAFKAGLLDLVPFLRAFARSLCGKPEMADDLAQEALVKAWQARSSFAAGTNLKAWLFTILRNQYYSDRRRSWRQQPWDEDAAERIPGLAGQQTWAAELSDVTRALTALSDEQREALILVGAGGFSYEDAAKICNCAVGTVKSRVARARRALISILEGTAPLPPAEHPAEGDAANDIMAQLDRLAPPQTPGHRPQAAPQGPRLQIDPIRRIRAGRCGYDFSSQSRLRCRRSRWRVSCRAWIASNATPRASANVWCRPRARPLRAKATCWPRPSRSCGRSPICRTCARAAEAATGR